MKKYYLQPDMEIVELNACQCLLAGSTETLDILDDTEPVPGSEALSPLHILDIETGIPGIPGM